MSDFAQDEVCGGGLGKGLGLLVVDLDVGSDGLRKMGHAHEVAPADGLGAWSELEMGRYKESWIKLRLRDEVS